MIDPDQSLNQTQKTLICNHCSYEFAGYAEMKEHYKSQFHLYNLHRVTMQLNPISYEDFMKKKEALEKNKAKEVKVENVPLSNFCSVCSKSFASQKKLQEHLSSNNHKQREEKKKGERKESNPLNEEKAKKPLLTAKDNHLICFVCNNSESKSIADTLSHLKTSHNFEFPVSYCMNKPEKALKLIIRKIFKYGACLYCDSQKFPNEKAIQCHMKDTNHIKINFEDIIDHFYKYYDKEKISQVTGADRKLKEFILIRRILIPKKGTKETEEIKEENDDEWEEISDTEENEKVEEPKTIDKKDNKEEDNEKDLDLEDDEIKNINYIKMENGEIMLKDGTVLGNKVYNLLYKQRVRMTPTLWKNSNHINLLKLKHQSARRNLIKAQTKVAKESMNHWKLKGSHKANFQRVNTLFTACKQVNC